MTSPAPEASPEASTEVVDPARVRALFDEAADLPTGEREAFVADACRNEPGLAHEVRALLGFLDDGPPLVPGLVADEAPATIGRFEVLGKLGQGGMGVVYRGYDRSLARELALKLVSGQGGRDARVRLEREAQALARVAHPNVVPVYEVGPHGDGVFVAMELVRGTTLTRWLAAKPRTWREVLRVVIDAGRGLAAAHRAGILHRDVKPDNVLVGDDGRARVVDFGLARGLDIDAAGEPGGVRVADARADDAPLAAEVTRRGALVGTPGYMSPEHFTGTLTPLADQWSFAVTAYRVLFGAMPYRSDDLLTLIAVVTSAEPPEPPPGDVPAAVVAVIRRGMARLPEARFPSLDAMLDELEAALAVDPDTDRLLARRQRHGVAIGLVGLGLAFLVLAGVRTHWRYDLGVRGTIVQGLLGLVAIVASVAVFRSAMWRTAHDRRVIALFAIAMVTMTVHRALSLDADVREVLRGDAVFLIGLLSLGALTIERWFALAAGLEVVYVIVAAVVPEVAVPLFGLLLIATVALGIWFWREPKISAGTSGASSRAETRSLGTDPPRS